MDMYTLLYLKQITITDLLHRTGNSAQCHVAECMGGVFGGGWIPVYVWLAEALHCSPESLTTLLTDCTSHKK